MKEGKFIAIENTYKSLGLTASDVYGLVRPPKSYLSGMVRRFEDYRSKYLNIINGYRFVPEQPSEYDNTIFIIGGCNQFGTGNPDNTTSASYLQEMLNAKGIKYRVENCSTYAERHRNDTLMILNSLPIKQGDIIIIGNEMTPNADLEKHYYANYHQFELKPVSGSEYGEMFTDLVHLSPNGNRVTAKQWFEYLVENDFFRYKQAPELSDMNSDTITGKRADISQLNWSSTPLFGVPQWANAIYDANSSVSETYFDDLESHKRRLQQIRVSVLGRIGAIVMNCNPFTIGHRYLIEQSAGKVKHLFIFVVEEDKSTFPFADRLRLVEQGTSDLNNVTVLPSGEFIISSLTFSDYFNKSKLQNRMIDPSQDVELFAKYIAPALGIDIRFAGEEPLDKITLQYNHTMARILPEYGIQFEVIPRKESGGVPISASRVRKLLDNEEWNEIETLVPKTTLLYLQAYKKS